MPNQAFDRGTCQSCGRVQKLPDGLLSLHGYTKQWSFFSGICFGARHGPLEVSKDLVEECIKRSEREIESLQRERADLVAEPTSETKAWRHIHVRAFLKDGDYQWRRGTITANTRKYASGGTEVTIHNFTWTGELTPREIHQKDRPLTQEIASYEMPGIKAVVDVIAELNRQYIKAVVDVGIKRHLSYIEWQRGRIENWAPKPLLPLDNAASEKRGADATAELVRAGAVRKAYGHRGQVGWWSDGNLFLGRGATQALTALKRIGESK